MKPDSELQEALDTLIRVCQHMGAMFAAKGVPLPELKDGECDLTISGSRRDIESLFERRIAEVEKRSNEGYAAHSTSFGALMEIAMLLNQNGVDDYADVVRGVEALRAELALLRETVQSLEGELSHEGWEVVREFLHRDMDDEVPPHTNEEMLDSPSYGETALTELQVRWFASFVASYENEWREGEWGTETANLKTILTALSRISSSSSIQRISLLEAARNDLLLVVEELNDLRKTAEANSLTREEWDMVISRLSTHDVRFGLSEKPAQLFRKLHALRFLSEEGKP